MAETHVDADQTFLAGSDLDTIWLAEVGTELPDDFTDPPVGFDPVGWLNSEGITETLLGSVSQIRGHQGGGVVRETMTEGGTQFAFNAYEDKALTNGLRYTVKETATVGGVTTDVVSPNQRPVQKAAVIDLFDAANETKRRRLCIPVLSIVPNGDRVYSTEDIAAFPSLGTVIGDYERLSQNTAPTP